MSYSVTVLLENGRRQRVPVKLSTPILIVLEEVCKKHKLLADDYDVKYHNRLLDVTSTIQFCGIANNAQLELVPATKLRVESSVTVFIQLESGERLSGSFLPSSSLHDVIVKLCGDETITQNPVIIYTRQEVLGDRLKTTTLKQLGLTGGNALLRLLHRTEDQLRNQSHSGVFNLPSKPKSEEPERRRKKEGTLKDFEENKPQNTRTEEHEHETSGSVDSRKSSELMDIDSPSTSSIVNDSKSGGSAVPSSSSTMDAPEPGGSKIPAAPTLPGKRGKNEPEEPVFNINDVKYLGERYALVFRTDEIKCPKLDDDTTDDFFELTVDDAKTLLRDLKRTRSQLEDAHLETAALKERKKSMLLERTVSIYPHCVVRVLFPDRFALQGVFDSTETIKEVINFVKTYVDVPILQFYLYTAPPKTIVKVTQSLVEIGAVPGINFYFGGPYVEENPTGPFLSAHFVNQTVSPYVALRVANHFRRGCGVRPPQPPPANTPLGIAETEDADRDLHVAPLPLPPNLRQNPPKVDGKVPKWFKPV